MTLRARRWYYSLAILLFLIAAPLVVGRAAGWRWTNWRQGFVQTGTLALSSTQRATILLDGRIVGTTPKRLNGLAPGVYRVELRKPGRTPWSHYVRIRSRATTAIGPIRLFPPTLSVTAVTQGTYTDYVVDPTLGMIAGWQALATGGTLQIVWPKTMSEPITLPSRPTWIRLSPRQQRLAIGLADETRLYVLSEPLTFRSLPSGDPMAWLSSSETIAYRLEDGHLVADDALQQTRSTVASATSLRLIQDSLWYTNTNSLTTTVYQRSDATAAQPRVVTTLPGTWNLRGQIGRAVVAQQTTTLEAMMVSINRLTGRVVTTPLGQMTDFPTQQTPTLPLWMNGIDLMTFNDQEEPVVLARTSLPPLDVAWVDPGHLLVSMEPTHVLVRSVSSQQGRGVLVDQELLTTDTPLLLDTENSSTLVNRNGQLTRFSWK